MVTRLSSGLHRITYPLTRFVETRRDDDRVESGAASRMGYATWLILVLVQALVQADEPASTTSAAPQAVRQHSFWEVSTRNLPLRYDTSLVSKAVVSKRDAQHWHRSSLEQLFKACCSSDCSRAVIYVHGNWMDWAEARRRAVMVYHRITAKADDSICFIAYTWPSQREHRFAKDVLDKKERIDAESFYLTGLLERLPNHVPQGMLSFSFGTRITCGVLQLHSGGRLVGRTVQRETVTNPIRVSLLAPAFDRESFMRWGRYNHALESVDQLVNLYNSSDPVLRRFRFFDRERSPTAAGYAGIPTPKHVPASELPTQPLTLSTNIKQYDCHPIGRTHSEVAYCSSRAFSVAIDNVLGR